MLDKILQLNPEEERKIKVLKSIVVLYLPEDIDTIENIALLALRLGSLFEKWYSATNQELLWLYYASLLHSIGSADGMNKYHVRTQNLILDLKILPFTLQERLIISCIARYHRKALPSIKHPHFSSLSPKHQNSVKWMASFLRLATDLHRYNASPEKSLKSKEDDSIILVCNSNVPYTKNEEPKIKRKDLLELQLGKKIRIKWEPIS